MSSADIEVIVFARPNRSLTIEERHAKVMSMMSRFDRPLGFSGLDLPPAPDCGDALSASFTVKFPIRGLRVIGDYLYRGAAYIYKDRSSFDERLNFWFKISNKNVDYKKILNDQLPKVIEAFEGYKATVFYGFYSMDYHGGPDHDNPVYKSLFEDPGVDVNGRNNIYTLNPAQFWDEELCHRALGYGPDEVIARLQGECASVERLMDGVYLVLNDDPHLSYEDFVEMNERIKPILGLI
ncbi:hypothetical protein [Bordetella sp. LUAb4]|uniref:hypothetical protein n=1 Tax=Bordetella sp. LUAb4 TaxID=2843195 RepID=UPI001E59BACA|nr:hypothetical protein [Bordetella sp. LUAb4]